MANEAIRQAAKTVRIPLWLIGETAYDGMTDAIFSRKLRHELPESETKRILGVIDRLAAEQRAQS